VQYIFLATYLAPLSIINVIITNTYILVAPNYNTDSQNLFNIYVANNHERLYYFFEVKMENTMDDKLILKKYTNRRLYDTEKSIYVTLDYVTNVIREGRQIVVVDAKTNEDVTTSILTQIVLEEARKKNFLLPNPLLYLIIQYGENVLSEFFEKYLEHTIKNYLLFRGFADDQYKKWLDLGDSYSQTNPQAVAGLSPFKSLFELFPGNIATPEAKESKK
jgi:polyhydroxyalkanoate synthesis repressor PhaR